MAERRYRLRGYLDFESGDALRADLLAVVNETSDDLVLDAAELEFIDSYGIAVIAQMRRLLGVHDRRLRIVNLRAPQRRPFEVLGLGDYLDIGESEDE